MRVPTQRRGDEGEHPFAERLSSFGRVAVTRPLGLVGCDSPLGRSVSAADSRQFSNSPAVDANALSYFVPFLQSTAHSASLPIAGRSLPATTRL